MTDEWIGEVTFGPEANVVHRYDDDGNWISSHWTPVKLNTEPIGLSLPNLDGWTELGVTDGGA